MTTSEEVQKWLGYLYIDELNYLKELTRGLPENPVVVNIGAGGGTSGLAFLETRADLTLYTIDKRKESSPFGCLAGEEAVLRSAGFWGDPRYEQIHGDSKLVGRDWIGPKLDLVMVDGDHLRAGVRGDIIAWRPHVKEGGLMVFHDFGAEKWPDVAEACDDLLGDQEIIGTVDTLRAYRIGGKPTE